MEIPSVNAMLMHQKVDATVLLISRTPVRSIESTEANAMEISRTYGDFDACNNAIPTK